ncbi:MAG: hypothetical protein GY953_20035 [bacterium]|nr:hypothetical protein [bacterium]
MVLLCAKAAATLVVAGALTTALAAGPSLGVITSNDEFLLDNSKVTGNATLTDGAVVEAGKNPANLRLEDGTRLTLNGGARAKVYRNRMVLEGGLGKLAGSGSYEVEAASYRIVPADDGASGAVYRADEKTVQVASAKGTLRVYDARGIQIANVIAGGDVLAFSLQEGGAAPPSSLIGCLLKKSGKYVVYDQTTRILVELRGDEARMEQEWGNRVQVIGTTVTSVESEVGAQVVDVSTLTRVGSGGCGTVATAISAELPASETAAAAPSAGRSAPSTAPTPGGGGGMSAGTKILIVAAIAGGGVGGAAAAGVLGGGNDGRSP